MIDAPVGGEAEAVTRWRATFQANPVAALERVLLGKVSLGNFDRARPAEALSQVLLEAELLTADKAMLTWLQSRLGKTAPEGVSAKRFAESLVEAFRSIALLRLTEARRWAAQHHLELRTWLKNFRFGRSRDAEAAALVALAQDQPSRQLVPLWQEIVRRGHPTEHVRHALTGLRLLPADDAGTVERGLPRALLQGLLDYGDALARKGDHKGSSWFAEIDFLAAVYPMTRDAWGRKFRELVQTRPPSKDVLNWLDQRYPLATKSTVNPAKVFSLHPGQFDELKDIFASECTPNERKTKLDQFLDSSRHYVKETGDAYYLVRFLRFTSDRVRDQDARWARELAHEATIWAPGDPRSWSMLARGLEAEGDWRRAEAVYWQARRRFPENVQSHSQLAHALFVHGGSDMGEAVYREAITLFPDNPVCRTDLGFILRSVGRYDEALAEFRNAQAIFHRSPIIAMGIADVLVEMGDLDNARDSLAWAEQIADQDDLANRQALARVRARLHAASIGSSVSANRTFSVPRTIAGGDWSEFSNITGAYLSIAPALGKATVLRRKSNASVSEAFALVRDLPDTPEKVAEEGLCIASLEGWQAAATFFDTAARGYEGSGMLRVHRQRARSRAGQPVDWTSERTQFPELVSVILTEERGLPPRPHLPVLDEYSEEQLQEIWYSELIAKQDPQLKDRAEEDFLVSRHVS